MAGKHLARLPQLGGHGSSNPLVFRDRTPKGRHYTVPNGGPVPARSGGDPQRGLCRQGHAELVQKQFVLSVRPGVARQDEVPAVGGRQAHVHHLDAGERLEDGARGEAAGARPGEIFQGDDQAVGDEGYEDVRLDPVFALIEDGPDREVVLEFLECLLDLD